MRVCACARERGYGVDHGNYIAGVTVVAAPVLNRAGRMAYGLAAVGIATQLNADRVAELGHDLREADRYVFGVLVTREHANPAGMIHGGMIASLLDQSVSTAAWEATGRQPCVTAQLDTHFVVAVRPGAFIEARSRVVRQAGSLVFVQAELSVASEIVATGAATIKVMRASANELNVGNHPSV